jgi:hypothetical protein
MTVSGGRPGGKERWAAFLAGAVATGVATYGLIALIGRRLGMDALRLGPAFVAASGVLLAIWYGWRRARRPMGRGVQISKRLARARLAGPLAYGAVLGAGVLTIVSTPAVWLGGACCLATGSPAWGTAYGAFFGTGRALMLARDSARSRGMPPDGVVMLVASRQLGQNRFWMGAVAGGLTLAGLATVTAAWIVHGTGA